MLHINQFNVQTTDFLRNQFLKTKYLLFTIGSLTTLTTGQGYQTTYAQTIEPSIANDNGELKQTYSLQQEILPIAQSPPRSTNESELNQYLLREPPTVLVPGERGKDSDTPGSSITSPSGFGANYGNLFASLGYQNRTRFGQRDDLGLSAGVGLGDARKSVGFEVTLGSFSPIRRGPFAVGSMSVKAHRLVSNDTSVALGVENIVSWGGTDGGSSIYGVASKYFQIKDNIDEPFSSVTASVGLGNGRFRSESDVLQNRGSVNPFASVGVRVARPVSFIMDWSGQTLGLGLSIAPIRDQPFTINPAIVDVTGGAGDGARLTIGIGYGITF